MATIKKTAVSRKAEKAVPVKATPKAAVASGNAKGKADASARRKANPL